MRSRNAYSDNLAVPPSKRGTPALPSVEVASSEDWLKRPVPPLRQVPAGMKGAERFPQVMFEA
jgi:hypothetical protein